MFYYTPVVFIPINVKILLFQRNFNILYSQIQNILMY
jgi:hypothetical protein